MAKKNLPTTKEERNADDLGYFKLVTAAIAGTLAVYWGLQFIRQSVMEYFIGIVFAVVVAGIAAVLAGRNHYRKSLPAAEEAHPVFRRYHGMLEEISDFSERKRGLLETSLVPQLRELIEEKLPELIERRDRYRSYWNQCNAPRLKAEISDLEERVNAESDPDIEKALSRNLAIARSTAENYATIEKTLKLYELQISSIDKHLENLDTKLHILDIDDDIKAAAETIVHGINCDIDDLEKALVQMDALRSGEEDADD